MMFKMRIFAVTFGVMVFWPTAFAQSEILLRFLHLNRHNLSVSQSCEQDLQVIDESLGRKDIWAMKMLDASASPSAGHVWGNNFWMGSYHGCLFLNEPPKIYLALNDHIKNYKNLTDIQSPMPVQYRMFYVNHDSTLQLDIDLFNKTILHIGVCFPSSCNNYDSQVMGREVFQSKSFLEGTLHKELWFISTKNLEVKSDFLNEPFVILALTISLTFFILVVCGTIFTVQLERYRRKLALSKFTPTPNFDAESLERKFKETVLEKFMLCFSLHKNCKFLVSKDLGKNSIPTIHGMRAIGMVWIMTGHIYCYAYGTIDNMQMTFAYAQSWILQPIFSTAISVDTFFVMSGFLLSYLFFETQKKRPTKNCTITFLKTIITRYIRITPCLAIIMLVTASLVIYQNNTSVFWPIEDYESNCKRFWWRNLLFIQNLYPLGDMCMSWSWYVAADFQMFVLSSLLLVIYVKNRKLCVFLSLVIAALAAAYSGYLGYTEVLGFSLDSQYKTIDLLYTKPYTRISAYFVGCWTGWYLSKINRVLRFQKTTILFGWILTISVTTLIVFGQHFKEPNAILGALFASFGRTLWAAAVSFIIVACSSGNGGFISSILHMKSLLPFSRMSYATYLLNPIVVIFIVMSSETALHLDFYIVPILTLGFFCATYIAAFVFMMLFENPCLMFIRSFIEK